MIEIATDVRTFVKKHLESGRDNAVAMVSQLDNEIDSLDRQLKTHIGLNQTKLFGSALHCNELTSASRTVDNSVFNLTDGLSILLSFSAEKPDPGSSTANQMDTSKLRHHVSSIEKLDNATIVIRTASNFVKKFEILVQIPNIEKNVTELVDEETHQAAKLIYKLFLLLPDVEYLSCLQEEIESVKRYKSQLERTCFDAIIDHLNSPVKRGIEEPVRALVASEDVSKKLHLVINSAFSQVKRNLDSKNFIDMDSSKEGIAVAVRCFSSACSSANLQFKRCLDLDHSLLAMKAHPHPSSPFFTFYWETMRFFVSELLGSLVQNYDPENKISNLIFQMAKSLASFQNESLSVVGNSVVVTSIPTPVEFVTAKGDFVRKVSEGLEKKHILASLDSYFALFIQEKTTNIQHQLSNFQSNNSNKGLSDIEKQDFQNLYNSISSLCSKFLSFSQSPSRRLQLTNAIQPVLESFNSRTMNGNFEMSRDIRLMDDISINLSQPWVSSVNKLLKSASVACFHETELKKILFELRKKQDHCPHLVELFDKYSNYFLDAQDRALSSISKTIEEGLNLILWTPENENLETFETSLEVFSEIVNQAASCLRQKNISLDLYRKFLGEMVEKVVLAFFSLLLSIPTNEEKLQTQIKIVSKFVVTMSLFFTSTYNPDGFETLCSEGREILQQENWKIPFDISRNATTWEIAHQLSRLPEAQASSIREIFFKKDIYPVFQEPEISNFITGKPFSTPDSKLQTKTVQEMLLSYSQKHPNCRAFETEKDKQIS